MTNNKANNILFIEPFYSGSHKTWLDQLQKYSHHHIDTLTMDGKFWKWRMYGSSFTLAEAFNSYTKPIDLIIVSDMLDLSTFISLTYPKLMSYPKRPQIALFFHENQLAYPWKEDSEDLEHNRDVHYGMMNYTSALAADIIFFNSEYNMKSFYNELEIILNKMPDYKHETISGLKSKSSVLPIGIKAPVGSTEKDPLKSPNQVPLIIWNHRLEHDKNPITFLETLIRLKENGYDFRLAFLGEGNSASYKEYNYLLNQLDDKIIAKGFQSLDKYLYYLQQGDILPVTSNHDFFGISVMEAISYGCYPLLPTRLTYPDLYDAINHPEIFYTTTDQLYEKLVYLIMHNDHIKNISYAHLTTKYRWEHLISVYDQLFLSIIDTIRE